MPYIVFDAFPESTGRTLTDGITDPADGRYFAATDDLVLDRDTVVTTNEYLDALARATQEYEDALARATQEYEDGLTP